MKKKKANLIMSFILPFVCTTTSCSSETPKVLLSRHINVQSTISLSSASQFQNATRFESCAVFVSMEGCGYCERTFINLQTYIQKYKAIIYEVDSHYYKEAYSDESNRTGKYANMYPKLGGYPAFLFYRDGKLVDAYLNSAVEYDQLENVMNAYTSLSNFYMLNDLTYDEVNEKNYLVNASEEFEETKKLDTFGFSTKNLDALIATPEKKTILFTWRRCPDCIDFKTRVLDKFIKQYPNEKIYYYETEGYMVGKRHDDETIHQFVSTLWSDFSQQYHLSDYAKLDEYNNLSGFVPSIISFDDDSYRLCVYSNALDIKVNNDMTLSYSKAFHEEILSLKSDTKVKADDPLASDYQKAKKELNQKRQKMDDDLSFAFLKEVLL